MIMYMGHRHIQGEKDAISTQFWRTCILAAAVEVLCCCTCKKVIDHDGLFELNFFCFWKAFSPCKFVVGTLRTCPPDYILQAMSHLDIMY